MVAVALAKFVAPDNPTPDQEYVTPDTGPPTNVVDVLAQLNVPPVADADGTVVFWVIDTTAVLVQLFNGLVMINV